MTSNVGGSKPTKSPECQWNQRRAQGPTPWESKLPIESKTEIATYSNYLSNPSKPIQIQQHSPKFPIFYLQPPSSPAPCASRKCPTMPRFQWLGDLTSLLWKSAPSLVVQPTGDHDQKMFIREICTGPNDLINKCTQKMTGIFCWLGKRLILTLLTQSQKSECQLLPSSWVTPMMYSDGPWQVPWHHSDISCILMLLNVCTGAQGLKK